MINSSLDSLLAELLELGRATACLPVQFTAQQSAEFVARVLEPLETLQRYGWYVPGTMTNIAQHRCDFNRRILVDDYRIRICAIRNPDFLLKNVDFIIKKTGKRRRFCCIRKNHELF